MILKLISSKFMIILFLCLQSLVFSRRKKNVDTLHIKTSKFGAELTSVVYKGTERLHDAKTFWNQHSPILFPIVGKLRYDATIINGKEYAIPKHGFAMNMNFTKIGNHYYKLRANEETLKQFPFDFELYVKYTTFRNKLIVNYRVVNKSPNETMLFGIGGHPGFKVDYYKEKATVEFEEEEDDIKIIPVDISVGLMDNRTIDGNTVLENKKILRIKKDSFVNDAIVFTNIKSKSVILKNDGKKLVKFNFRNFKYLGIWSAVGDAPYVCFEPWYNTPDYVNSTKEFKEKKDIITLKPRQRTSLSYSVEFF